MHQGAEPSPPYNTHAQLSAWAFPINFVPGVTLVDMALLLLSAVCVDHVGTVGLYL